MEFMLLFLERGFPKSEPAIPDDMEGLVNELSREGKLARKVLLNTDSPVTRLRVHDGKTDLNQMPSGQERIAGFWIIDVAGRDEAIEIARRAPHATRGLVEVHLMRTRHTYADSHTGAPYLFTFHREPELTDPDGMKYELMMAYSADLQRKGALAETAPLAIDPPPARVESQSGKILVTDGPFAEAKEGVGGYGLIRAANRAAAIEIAQDYPHATWGPLEIRDAVSFD